MIVGHGDIATALRNAGVDREDRIYFASGVSNSSETRENEYAREHDLLRDQDSSLHLVYFSSLCVFYSDSRYSIHKRNMESLVDGLFDRWTIFRLGNIAWGRNPNTLINFICNKIRNREPVEIRDEWRYVIGEDEFLHWIRMIPEWSCEMNVPGRMMKVTDIVREYCYPWKNFVETKDPRWETLNCQY